MDEPPTSIDVGGFSYACAIDYRVWIEVYGIMTNLNVHPNTEEEQTEMVENLNRIQTLVFGGPLLDENIEDVLKAVAKFMSGYPSAPINGRGESQRGFSYDYDLNAIIIAIRNQSGIDLSYRRKEPFHWWLFLLEFQTLCGDHYILNLIHTRTYKGNDETLKQRKEQYALPYEFTAAEIREYEELNALFEEGDDET